MRDLTIVGPGAILLEHPGMGLSITLIRGAFAICRLEPDGPVPDWALSGEFCSLTRTREELSVICPQGDVPGAVEYERDWRCLKVQGPLGFSEIGVLRSLAAPLAEAGISILAISTFETDYVLVRAEDLQRACQALLSAGHRMAGHTPEAGLNGP